MKKPSRISKDPGTEEPVIPDRHFRRNEPEMDYRMDKFERRIDQEEEPGVDEVRREQDDDE